MKIQSRRLTKTISKITLVEYINISDFLKNKGSILTIIPKITN